MARHLDRQRPFGMHYPIGKDGAAFEQDGRQFNNSGVELGGAPEAAPPAAAAPEPAPAPAANPVSAPELDQPEPVSTDQDDIPVDRLTDEQLTTYVRNIGGKVGSRFSMLALLAENDIKTVRPVDLL